MPAQNNDQGSEMPFYTLDDMREGAQKGNPTVSVHSAVGEFMKVAVVTKPEGKGPALHSHPNEEQWTLILEGQMHFILGDEDRIVGPGTSVYIPRNMLHRSRPVNGPATFCVFPDGHCTSMPSIDSAAPRPKYNGYRLCDR